LGTQLQLPAAERVRGFELELYRRGAALPSFTKMQEAQNCMIAPIGGIDDQRGSRRLLRAGNLDG
jgi:hypothetical protein